MDPAEIRKLMIIGAELIRKGIEEANDHLGSEVIGNPNKIDYEFKLDHMGKPCGLYSDTPVITVYASCPFKPGLKVESPATKFLEETAEATDKDKDKPGPKKKGSSK